MAWTYSIQSKNKDNGLLKVIVNFTNNVDAQEQKIFSVVLLDDLKVQIQNELNRLAVQDTTAGLIPASGQLDLTPTPDPAPVTPNIDPTPTPVTPDPVASKRMLLAQALNDFNIKLIDQATYDQKVQDILNAK